MKFSGLILLGALALAGARPLDFSNDVFEVVVYGNGNVPKVNFKSLKEENAPEYKLMLKKVFEVDSFENGKKVPGPVTSLPSLSWKFDSMETTEKVSEEDSATNATEVEKSTTSFVIECTDPDLQLKFTNHLKEETWKFDVELKEYQFKDPSAGGLRFEFMLNQASEDEIAESSVDSAVSEESVESAESGDDGEDTADEEEKVHVRRVLQAAGAEPSTVEDEKVCFKFDGVNEVCFESAPTATAKTNSTDETTGETKEEETVVNVRVEYDSATGAIALIYERFVGDLYHDPDVGFTSGYKAGGSDNDDDGGFICFPGSSVVEEQARGLISMDELRIGDSVRAGRGRFSKVHGFYHLERDAVAGYLQFGFANKEGPLEMSEKHMVFANGVAVPAGDVRVGDKLGEAVVKSIQAVKRRGIYAPATFSGDIVVDGILASTYSSHMEHAAINEHAGAHLLLTYHRLICRFDFGMCEGETYSKESLSNFVAPVIHLAYKIGEYGAPVQVAATVVALPFMAALYALEQLILAPVILLMVAGWYFNSKKNKSKVKSL